MARIYLTMILLFLTAQFSHAQSLFETAGDTAAITRQQDVSVQLSGYTRGVAYGGGQQYDYTSLFGEFAIKGRLALGKAFMRSDVRFRSGQFFNERQSLTQLKEAYAGYKSSRLDVFLGTQVVVWGRTDGFNPTNNIIPTDYFFLTPDPDDQRLSNFMLRAKARLWPEIELDLVAIPFYKPSVYRYDLFDMGQGVRFLEMRLPEASFKNGSMAARLNFELPGAGFSFSWFRGYDPFYGYKLDSLTILPNFSIRYRPESYKKHVVGADLAIPLSTWILRSEATLSFTTAYERNMHIPNPDVYYVFGLEHNFRGFTAILQYIGKYTLYYKGLELPVLPKLVAPSDPAYPAYIIAMIQYNVDLVYTESAIYNRKIFHQQQKTNHALMLSVNKSFAYETIVAGLTVYYDFTSEEYLLRPEIDFKIDDALTVSLGGSVMNGPGNSVFYRAGKVLNGMYIGLNVSF